MREDEIPSGDDDRDEPPTDTGEEDASEASSNESRGAARFPFLASWVKAPDILVLCVLRRVFLKVGETRIPVQGDAEAQLD